LLWSAGIQTVFDVGAADEVDLLTGSSGEDWILYNDGREGGAADKLAGVQAGAFRTDIDIS
jgi:hypothetical protein